MAVSPASTGRGADQIRYHLLEQARRRQASPPLWFLRLGVPAWLLGAVTAAALLGFFALLGTLPTDLAALDARRLSGLGSSLFFSCSIGFLFAAGGHVLPATVRDLERLRDLSPLTSAEHDALLDAMTRYPVGQLLVGVVLALVFGAVHSSLITGGAPLVVEGSVQTSILAAMVGTLSIWLMMFQLATPLLANAYLITLLGRISAVDLLDPDRMAPFGTTALRPTLVLIGLQSFYPLLALDGEPVDPWAFVGIAVSLSVVLGLFFLPLRGIHERITDVRATALRHLDARLAESAVVIDDPRVPIQALRDTEALLALRDRLTRVSSWPLGSSGTRRMLLYIVIPPLAWTAAILLEVALERSI